MGRKGLLITLIIVVLLGGSFIAGMLVYLVSSGGGSSGGWLGGKKVGVVTVEGAIISSKDVIEDIESFRDNDNITSILLRIESPGGSVASSQEILEALQELAKEKPIVASMGSVAASGGYYVACGAQHIFANPGTITGSIGVRMEHIMIGDLLKWMKIQHETLKSGRYKDMFSIERKLTPEERVIAQTLLDDIHDQFKAAVATARDMDPEEVDKIADGRIFTGQEALALGLVDELGGFTKALKHAGELGGIKDWPKTVYPKRKYRLFERFFTEATSALGKGQALLMNWWQPMYLWQARIASPG